MKVNGIEIPNVVVDQFRSGQVTKDAFLTVLNCLDKVEIDRIRSAQGDEALREIQNNVKYLDRMKDFFEKLLTKP